MPNPYLWRTTITDPEDFYGRKEEIEDIYERIKSKYPQSVAVVSERRMGKSSLLYYIYHEKDKYLDDPEKYIFIFIDIQGETINSKGDFFRVLLKRLRENEKIRDKIVVDDTDNYENIKKIVSELDKNGYKLILFIDEFDVLVRNENIQPEFYGKLRSLANRYAIAYVTASVKNQIEMIKEYGSPLFNIATEMHIGSFKINEAIELIEKPSNREGVPLKNDSDFILDIAGLHPLFIQIACYNLFKYKIKKGELSKSDYERIKDYLDESVPHLEYIWKHLDKKEKDVLSRLASSKSISKRSEYQLKDLERKGYVIKKGKEYEIFSSVFKDFVVEQRNKDVEGREDGNSDIESESTLETPIPPLQEEQKEPSRKIIKHDVFICYSSEDKSVADATCAKLESKGIRCWFAPRDVLPGTNFQEALIDAIDNTRIMVLIFSSHSNTSSHVIRELTEAVSNSVIIIPFRIEDVLPSKSMKYLISLPHWLDAQTPPLEQHLEKLAETIQLFLNKKKGKQKLNYSGKIPRVETLK